MFSKLTSIITTTLAVSSAALAAPSPSAGVNVEVCTDTNLSGCTTIPVTFGVCVNFQGDYSSLNNAVSSASIPAGSSCTFYDITNCNVGSSSGGPWVALAAGDHDDLSTLGFDNLASSFFCNPA
ncbi:hypothetical protein NP233_g5536 [Leucocoprinus birnbaumii]|uniref:Uncharacterized protein n=1 Tax=Leucocoprinus birnbaumii TaxID=56174 RepID=A0AAD5VTX6_9AGAR|nr:hypothetical protein NP233_g5536 [Leucocoprinus birnbaumii]